MMSLDKRLMFPRPLFCTHFRNNDFTILLSRSILTADDGDDCGTTVEIHKKGEATNAFRIHIHTVSCSYHSPAAPTFRQCLAVTIRLHYSQSGLLLQLTLPFIIRRHSESLLY